MLPQHQDVEPVDEDAVAAANVALRLLARERGRAERDPDFQLQRHPRA